MGVTIATALSSAVALACESAPALAPPAQRWQPLYRVIYDGRHPACVAFAAWLGTRGVPVRSLDGGDVTRVWFDELALRWRERPAAIAGMTAPEALFCLEQLAWDHRLRVTFRADHRVRSDGLIEHRLQGLPSVPREVAAMAEEIAWGGRMAQLASECPRRRPALAAEPFVLLGRSESPARQTRPLVSWVIAPVSRA